MKEENINSQMRKGVLELCILAVLSRQDAYTNDLVLALKEKEMIVVEGAIYPLLTRLKRAGYLAYRWEESAQGPPRKYYSLSPAGYNYFHQLRAAWLSTVSTVEQLLEVAEPHGGDSTNEA